jgi:hypothetical protein
MNRGEYNARGLAADGSFGTQYPNQGERHEQRQERREDRQDRRDAEREDWQEYAEDHYEGYDDGYYGDYYGEEEAPVYWTLSCQPNVIALGGIIYYVCDSTWYIRAYYDGDVVYTEVPPPPGRNGRVWCLVNRLQSIDGSGLMLVTALLVHRGHRGPSRRGAR